MRKYLVAHLKEAHGTPVEKHWFRGTLFQNKILNSLCYCVQIPRIAIGLKVEKV